jgi:hypothetical protein
MQTGETDAHPVFISVHISLHLFHHYFKQKIKKKKVYYKLKYTDLLFSAGIVKHEAGMLSLQCNILYT